MKIPDFEYKLLEILSYFIGPIIRRMSITGGGTNRCLEKGCLPLPVHYYSPVPDLPELRKRQLWKNKSALNGISCKVENQLFFLERIGKAFGNECQWKLHPNQYFDEFTLNNGNFSFGCAVSLYCIIRDCKSKKIIEIGSGNSSLIIQQAILENKKEDPNYHPEYTIIDPYPRKDFSDSPYVTKIIKEKVECVPQKEFFKLESGDILFVDSSHTVKIGSDVNFLILDILPGISSGVFVHFHDIPLPYEYPEAYFSNPKFRMLWTESYLLQAFLCFNTAFEIKLAMNLIMTEHLSDFTRIFPQYAKGMEPYISGSLWLMRK